MIMKKKLTVRIALLIVCALNINTTFAQNVRQKPVIKKQTTTTKQASTPKKQNKSVAKKPSSPVVNVQLKDLLTKPFGIVNIDMQNFDIPFGDIESRLKQKYVIYDKQSITGKDIYLYDFDNPSFKNIHYNGLPLSSFRILNNNNEQNSSCRLITYCFEIYKNQMKKSLSKYLESIINDFHELGIPINFETGNDGKKEANIKVGNIKYEIKIFESVYYWIWIHETIYK